MINQAVILCGGNAERLQDRDRGEDFLMGIPKPLVEVGGQPFAYYAISTFCAMGVEDVVLVVKEDDLFHYTQHLEWRRAGIWRLSMADVMVDKGVLGIADLDDTFILLNGDCLPVMGVLEWGDYVSHEGPLITVKTVGDRDAGMATVRRKDIEEGKVSCGNLAAMRDVYRPYLVSGGLHVGTPRGLHRARQFVHTYVFGLMMTWTS